MLIKKGMHACSIDKRERHVRPCTHASRWPVGSKSRKETWFGLLFLRHPRDTMVLNNTESGLCNMTPSKLELSREIGISGNTGHR